MEFFRKTLDPVFALAAIAVLDVFLFLLLGAWTVGGGETMMTGLMAQAALGDDLQRIPFWNIVFPLILPVVVIVVLISTISTISDFELPYLLTSQDEGQGAVSVLVVPLRTGGRVFGAMAMTARGSESFSRTDMALAQQLADLAAPHLELARRSGGLGGPIMPGWRRAEVREQVEEE